MTKSKDASNNLEACDTRRILVADDDEEIRDLFALTLSCDLPDCRIDVAVNGLEVIEAFRTVHYGIFVMDVRMPVLDGQEAFEEIQKICKQENLEMPAFVFCTGYDVPDRLQEIIEEDPRHCVLKKPVDSDTLVEALRGRMGD